MSRPIRSAVETLVPSQCASYPIRTAEIVLKARTLQECMELIRATRPTEELVKWHPNRNPYVNPERLVRHMTVESYIPTDAYARENGHDVKRS
jgi:hypothetical protein